MKTPPLDLQPRSIALALSERWGIAGASLTYVPLGFGSHHWIAETPNGGKWFVTVDDLRADHLADNEEASLELLTTAFQTAAHLRDTAGLSFVIGPTPNRNDGVVVRLTEHFSVAVFQFLDVAPTEYGEFRDPHDRNEAMRLVGQVHNATDQIATGNLRRNTLVIPGRAGLVDAMASLDSPWKAGPYAEPARRLLRESADSVFRKLQAFDSLVSQVMRASSSWVVTHGEPHAGNIIRTGSGQLVIVDWDSVALAPRERDLWMLVNESKPDWTDYRETTATASLSQPTMDAYGKHWDMSEIAIYVAWCRRPHERTEEMVIAWESLQQYVSH